MRFTRAISILACIYFLALQPAMAQSTGKSYTNTIEIGKSGVISSEEKIKAAKEDEAKKEAERLQRRNEIAGAKAKKQVPLSDEEAKAKAERKERYAKLQDARKQRKAASINLETRAKNMAVLGMAREMTQANLRELTAQQNDLNIEAQNQFGAITGSGRAGYTRKEISEIIALEKAKKAVFEIVAESSLGRSANFVGWKLHRDYANSTPFIDSEWESFAESILNTLSSENRVYKDRKTDRWKAGQP